MMPPVRGGDPLRNAQAQAAAFDGVVVGGIAAIEAVEDAREFLQRYPGAGVGGDYFSQAIQFITSPGEGQALFEVVGVEALGGEFSLGS